MMNQKMLELVVNENEKTVCEKFCNFVDSYMSRSNDILNLAAIFYFASENKLDIVPIEKMYQGRHNLALNGTGAVYVNDLDYEVPNIGESDNIEYTLVGSGIVKSEDIFKSLGMQLLKKLYEDSLDEHGEYKRFDASKSLLSASFAEFLTELGVEWFDKFKAVAFDYMLECYQASSKSEKSIYSQPYEVSLLSTTLLGVEKGDIVRNDYSNIAEVATAITDLYDGNVVLYTGEANITNYLLGCIRLLFHKTRVFIAEDDSRLFYYPADKIIGTPSSFFGTDVNGKVYSDQAEFLEDLHKSCKQTGVGIFSEGICLGEREGLVSIRKEIIDQDFLDSVILLPTLPAVRFDTPKVIVVINKQKNKKGIVRFVDASKCTLGKGFTKVLDVPAVLSLYHSETPCDKVKDVSNTIIAGNQYSWDLNLYMGVNIDVPEGMVAVTVQDLVEPIITDDTEIEDSVQYDLPYSFIKKSLTGVISAEYLSVLKSNHHNDNLLHVRESCVVMSREAKPFYIENIGVTVQCPLIRNLSQGFRLKGKQCLPGYMVKEFQKPYFVAQLKRYYNACPTMFPIFGFLNSKVLLPVDSKDQITRLYDEQQESLRKRGIAIDTLNAKKHELFVRGQRERKHAVAQVLNDILPTIDVLERTINTRSSVSKDTVINRRFGATVGEYIANLHIQFNKVAQMVENFTRFETYGEPENVNLKEFLEEYCKSKLNDSYNIVFENASGTELTPYVQICKSNLTQALDNLVTNAKVHGFKDITREDYEVRIRINEFTPGDETITFSVLNNGEPVTASISLDKLFVWGVGNKKDLGEGIGCSHTMDILSHFDGDISYKEHPEAQDGLVCEFEIVLPLNIREYAG